MALPTSSLARGSLALVGLALAIVAFVSANMVIGKVATGLRVDLTEEKLFTLSPGTRNLLARIEEPVTLRLSVSERLTRAILHTLPGEADLTAHVDFTALADAARHAGLTIGALATQGDWLRRLGIDARLASLAAAAPTRADELKGQRDRLVEPREMGELFKVMTVTAPHWPAPAGFAGDAA